MTGIDISKYKPENIIAPIKKFNFHNKKNKPIESTPKMANKEFSIDIVSDETQPPTRNPTRESSESRHSRRSRWSSKSPVSSERTVSLDRTSCPRRKIVDYEVDDDDAVHMEDESSLFKRKISSTIDIDNKTPKVLKEEKSSKRSKINNFEPDDGKASSKHFDESLPPKPSQPIQHHTAGAKAHCSIKQKTTKSIIPKT